MKSVFEINNYREACKFLQKKYDKKGFVRKDYYHADPKDGHLIKTSGVGHGKDGLQYHHICEDIVPSLSDKSMACIFVDVAMAVIYSIVKPPLPSEKA